MQIDVHNAYEGERGRILTPCCGKYGLQQLNRTGDGAEKRGGFPIAPLF